jgi:hypothetical protein
MKKIMKHIASFALVLAVIVVPQAVSAAGTAFKWDMSVASDKAELFGISIETPSNILTTIIGYILAIVAFLGVLMFIISGIMYLVSAGDEKKSASAKATMTNAIIGIIVALIGYVVMAAISTLVGATSSGGL